MLFDHKRSLILILSVWSVNPQWNVPNEQFSSLPYDIDNPVADPGEAMIKWY